MIQQIAPAALHPALGDSILPGASERSRLRPASHCSDGSNHIQPELLVALKDHVFVRALERKCFAQLLHGPKARRIARDVEMKNAPTIVGNEEKQ
jgi:hypothetical protein